MRVTLREKASESTMRNRYSQTLRDRCYRNRRLELFQFLVGHGEYNNSNSDFGIQISTVYIKKVCYIFCYADSRKRTDEQAHLL